MNSDVFDVAQYILQKRGTMTTVKLQTLVYYAQAWALAWSGQPLFGNVIEAWDRGPVVHELWDVHRGLRLINALPASHLETLDADHRETIDAILERYGDLSPEMLSELTHAESPWRDTHRQSNTTEIPLSDLESYYRQLGWDLLQDMTSDSPADLFHLKLLLMQVTTSNRHDAMVWGASAGQEVW